MVLLARFSKTSSFWRPALVIALTGLVSWADVYTPPYIFLTGFYLVPISIAIWYCGRLLTQLTVATSIITNMYMVSMNIPSRAPLSHQLLSYSSVLIIFSGYALMVLRVKSLVQALRQSNEDLERRVIERTMELGRTNDELLKSNMELKSFAHAAAHDLQTPLRSITGFAQLLQHSAGPKLVDQEREWLEQVIENTKRLHQLIKDLLFYARLDAQSRPRELISTHRILDEVIATLADPIANAGAKISYGELPTVRIERTQFAQLLQNLLENAIKYRSDEPLRISISSECQGNEWVFSIADNGIGIAPKHHQKIFHVFRRLHTHSDIPGNGIGLAVCQRIVERHGGRIWVEAGGNGKGSTFRFSIPADGQSQTQP